MKKFFRLCFLCFFILILSLHAHAASYYVGVAVGSGFSTSGGSSKVTIHEPIYIQYSTKDNFKAVGFASLQMGWQVALNSTYAIELGVAGNFFYFESFKGIEASSVIVVDVGIPNDHAAFTKEDLYVATTRATTRLALLSSKKNIIEYFQ